MPDSHQCPQEPVHQVWSPGSPKTEQICSDLQVLQHSQLIEVFSLARIFQPQSPPLWSSLDRSPPAYLSRRTPVQLLSPNRRGLSNWQSLRHYTSRTL